MFRFFAHDSMCLRAVMFFMILGMQMSGASEIVWTAEGKSPSRFADFLSPMNWQGGIVPNENDTAIIGSGRSINAVIENDESVNLDGLRIGIPAVDNDGVFELLVGGELNVNWAEITAPVDSSAWLMATGGSQVSLGSLKIGDPSSNSSSSSTLWIGGPASVIINNGGIQFESAELITSVSQILVENGGILDLVASGQSPIDVISGPATIDISAGFVHVLGKHSTFDTISDRVEVLTFGTPDQDLLRFEYDQPTDTTWITSVPPPTPVRPGDANQDQYFDQQDIIKVLQAAKYLTGQPATWGEGDWNGGPGGTIDDPPPGDGLFNQLDVITALKEGWYNLGPPYSFHLDQLSSQNESAPYSTPEPNSSVIFITALPWLIVAFDRMRCPLIREAVHGTN